MVSIWASSTGRSSEKGLWETRMDVRAGKSGGRASSTVRVGRELKEMSRFVIDVKIGGVSVELEGGGWIDEIWL